MPARKKPDTPKIDVPALLSTVDTRMDAAIQEMHLKIGKIGPAIRSRDSAACRMVLELLRDVMSADCRDAIVNEIVKAAEEQR